jgi:transposase
MREVDRLMVEEHGVTLLQMMGNAGRSLAALARIQLGGNLAGARIAALVGRGNNGGGVAGLVRERSRTEDGVAFVAALGRIRPQVQKLLIWDNAPPHHPHRVRDTAAAAQIALAFLPFRSPELNPCEDLRRQLKRVVAANRVYASLEILVERALSWLDAHPPDAIRCSCGLTSSKFDWLPT